MKQYGRGERKMSEEVLAINAHFYFKHRHASSRNPGWARHYIRRLRSARRNRHDTFVATVDYQS